MNVSLTSFRTQPQRESRLCKRQKRKRAKDLGGSVSSRVHKNGTRRARGGRLNPHTKFLYYSIHAMNLKRNIKQLHGPNLPSLHRWVFDGQKCKASGHDCLARLVARPRCWKYLERDNAGCWMGYRRLSNKLQPSFLVTMLLKTASFQEAQSKMLCRPYP